MTLSSMGTSSDKSPVDPSLLDTLPSGLPDGHPSLSRNPQFSASSRFSPSSARPQHRGTVVLRSDLTTLSGPISEAVAPLVVASPLSIDDDVPSRAQLRSEADTQEVPVIPRSGIQAWHDRAVATSRHTPSSHNVPHVQSSSRRRLLTILGAALAVTVVGNVAAYRYATSSAASSLSSSSSSAPEPETEMATPSTPSSDVKAAVKAVVVSPETVDAETGDAPISTPDHDFRQALNFLHNGAAMTKLRKSTVMMKVGDAMIPGFTLSPDTIVTSKQALHDADGKVLPLNGVYGGQQKPGQMLTYFPHGGMTYKVVEDETSDVALVIFSAPVLKAKNMYPVAGDAAESLEGQPFATCAHPQGVMDTVQGGLMSAATGSLDLVPGAKGLSDAYIGAPLVNAKGVVVGMVARQTLEDGTIRFFAQMLTAGQINGLLARK